MDITISDQGWRSQGLANREELADACVHNTRYDPVNLQTKKNAATKAWYYWFLDFNEYNGLSSKKLLPSLNTHNIIIRTSPVESLNCNDS